MARSMSEVWRPIPQAPGYEASSFGRLRRGERIIAGSRGPDGYVKTRIRFDGQVKHVAAHRLVAAAFHGECPAGLVVDHIDCDRANNSPENLRYLSAADNVRRPYALGRGAIGLRHGRNTKPERSARGERVNTAKLTAADVASIRDLAKAGAFQSDLARQFSVGASQISNIVNRRSWKHIP